MSEKDMTGLRAEIDRIDAEIQRLFEERMDVSAAIGAYKAARGIPVYDGEREKQKIGELRRRASGDFRADGIERLYRTIFEISRDCQNGTAAKSGGTD